MTSSLFEAIWIGDLHNTRELLEVNEDLFNVNVRNSMGETPLHVACWYGRHQIAKFQVQEKKANVNAVDCGGNAPLFFLLFCNATEKAADIAELLLANGANVNSKVDSTSETILHRACFRGMSQLIQVLLNHGVHINARDGRGETPLYNACLHRHIDAIKLLLANNADRHIKNNFGYGPKDMDRLGEVFTSYDKWPLAVQALDNNEHPTPRKKRKYTQEGAVRLNPGLSQHQHALALKALLLVRQSPVHEVAYQVLGFLSPAAIEKIFLQTE